MVSPEFDPYVEEADMDLESGGFGCIHCHFEGWHHNCCDDLCYGCNEPAWCDTGGRPCRYCNPHGEVQ